MIYVNYSSGARDLFTRWYEERYGAAAQEDELFQKLTHRAHLHVKKIAAVYALLENDPAAAYASGELLCTDITADQMQAALDVVTYTLESARYLANTWTGPRSAQQETQQRLEQRVRLMLHKHGCMRKSALLRHLNNTSTDELNRALEALNGSELTYSDKARPQWVHARKCQCSKRAPAADSSEHKGEK